MSCVRPSAASPSTPSSVAEPKDPLCFSRIYRQRVGYVYRLLMRFGVATAEVEDATQEVFMIVHRRLPEFDADRGTIKTWLFALARGVAANRRRRIERRLRLLPPAPASATDARPTPEQTAADRELLAMVGAFLAELPESQRAVFELSEIDGLRGPEIATALGVKLNTVYTRLRTARLAFKAHVAKVAPEIRGQHG